MSLEFYGHDFDFDLERLKEQIRHLRRHGRRGRGPQGEDITWTPDHDWIERWLFEMSGYPRLPWFTLSRDHEEYLERRREWARALETAFILGDDGGPQPDGFELKNTTPAGPFSSTDRSDAFAFSTNANMKFGGLKTDLPKKKT
jgi:hypothetical protein